MSVTPSRVFLLRHGETDQANTLLRGYASQLPPDEAAASVAALKQMLTRKKASADNKLPVASTKRSN